MKKEEIELSLHDGSLSVSGERKHEEKLGRRAPIAPNGSLAGSSAR